MRIMLIRILEAHVRKIFYISVIIMMAISGYTQYLTWLNPLGLKPEQDPKQHDGSQEFNPHQEWKSSIEPMPDEDGVRRYLDPWELYHHGKDFEKEFDK